MKKNTFLLVGTLAVMLFALAYCKSQKPLFYQEDGNYFVDDNFVIAKTKQLSEADVKQLIALDADSGYLKLTQGRLHLLTTIRISRIQRLTQISQIARLDQLARLTRYAQIQRILDINKGCFELQQIDWAAYGDLKVKLDNILNKYQPALVNGNVSIVNNQIATAAVQLSAGHISELNNITIQGADEINICGDYMGPNKFTRILKTVRTIRPDDKLNVSLQKILVQYNTQIR
jgi:hypothetical protein